MDEGRDQEAVFSAAQGKFSVPLLFHTFHT